MIFLAMVFGITMYAIVAGVMIGSNDGKGLVENLDGLIVDMTVWIGGGAAIGAITARQLMQRGLEDQPPAAVAARRFVARLVPIAILEAGALFALTIWLLSGKNVPPLAVAMVLLSIAIAIVPFRDPDEGA